MAPSDPANDDEPSRNIPHSRPSRLEKLVRVSNGEALYRAYPPSSLLDRAYLDHWFQLFFFFHPRDDLPFEFQRLGPVQG